MRRRNFSLTAAICISLCLHAWAVHALIDAEDVHLNQQALSLAHRQATAREKPPIQVIDQPKPPAPVNPPPPPAQQFGQATGKGQAINSSSGLAPLRARRGPQAQAMLSRNPGPSDNSMDRRLLAAVLAPQDASENFDPATITSPPLLPPRKSPIELSNVMPTKTLSSAPDIQPERRNPEQSKISNLKFGIANSSRSSPRPANQETEKRVARLIQPSPAAPTDPGQLSDSESDAFSDVGTLVFRGGRLEARFGRKFRTVRPRFTISGQIDLATLADPSVQLIVHTDATGKPTRVEILRSSGSENIDEPVRLAMYQWWFEPPKNKAGKSLPDVMLWTIEFR